MEYIEREAVNKLLKDACDECRDACEEFDGIYADCNQCIMHGVVKGLPGIPAADVAPVRHGRWIRIDYEPIGHDYICSVCGGKNDRATHYCPDCGARMDRDGDGE